MPSNDVLLWHLSKFAESLFKLVSSLRPELTSEESKVLNFLHAKLPRYLG
jgi:hypothetical protein